MKIKLIKEILKTIDLDTDYSIGQYKKLLKEINDIVNDKELEVLGVKLRGDECIENNEYTYEDGSSL